MKIVELWEHPENLGYYKKAIINWSKPKIWFPDYDFEVPKAYHGTGGVYRIMRDHWKQTNPNIITYIGKADNFNNRLTTQHDKYNLLVAKAGDTKVSCGTITFQGIRADNCYFVEIEDILKFSVWHSLENTQGFGSLPGFRSKLINPWIIENIGYKGMLPKRIYYPAFAMEYR